MKSILLILIISINSFSQKKIIKHPPEYIRTVKFYSNGDISNVPAIQLGDRLNLEFDDISADNTEYYYTIEHYTPNWKKSDLVYLEYINGYEEDQILNVSSSFNTDVEFINYKLSIPNENISIKLSGNYLLKIFTEDKSKPLFTMPFVVYERKVFIEGKVIRPNNISKIDTHQQITFNVFHKNYKIEDYTLMKILVLQNGNFDTMKENIIPKFMKKDIFVFNENNNIIFKGNNEFRNIDIKDDISTAKDISHIERKGLLNYYILTQLPWEGEYTINNDINGQFKVRSLRAENQSTESNYVLVHFRAYVPEKLKKKQELFVYGAFNYWDLNQENKMKYNEEKNRYEADILLKQGFYDYKFVMKENGKIYYDFFDKSSYQTENNYQIIVYYKNIFERYYRCIGFTNLSSKSIRN